MQRNYPRVFSPADDRDKDGFKLENDGPLYISKISYQLENICGRSTSS